MDEGKYCMNNTAVTTDITRYWRDIDIVILKCTAVRYETKPWVKNLALG